MFYTAAKNKFLYTATELSQYKKRIEIYILVEILLENSQKNTPYKHERCICQRRKPLIVEVDKSDWVTIVTEVKCERFCFDIPLRR